METFDLHMHTTHSDGLYPTEAVIQHAASLGLTGIAITDHNVLGGAKEAREIAPRYGLEWIPAVEIDSYWTARKTQVDLLGYFIDVDNVALQQHLQRAVNGNNETIRAYCHDLTQAGYPISFEEVEALNPNMLMVAGIVEVMVNKGIAPTFEDGVPILRKNIQQVRPWPTTMEENIAAIHAAGGVAVLAHPCLVPGDAEGEWLPQQAVESLVSMGLDGIEIYHTEMNDSAKAHFLAIAQQLNLPISGGSDEHGRNGFLLMGKQPVTREMVENLRAKSRNWSLK